MKDVTLDNLIEALRILRMYGNPSYPTNCEHDIFRVYGIAYTDISKENMKLLEDYGFGWDPDFDCFYSTAYGSN